MRGMVVDTSAAVAVLTSEPGHEELKRHLENANDRLMSSATLLELGIVVESKLGDRGAIYLDQFLRDAQIEIIALTHEHAERGREGWRRFGKGRGHAAQLNLGDCYTFGLAAATGYPILCTGDDFAATDIAVVRPT